MLVSILLIVLTAAGGLAVSYLIDTDEPLLWRLAAGTVIGSAVYGTLVLILGSFTGLAVAAPAALGLTMAPMLLFRDKAKRGLLQKDWRRANDKLQGRTRARSLTLLFYVFFFLLFCLFFSQAMYQTQAGIFTGGSHNLGDLPFHLGAIYSFTEAGNLPPQNPSFAGAKFSYPFVSDLATAAFMKLGADIRSAMLAQNVAWALALLVLLERFVYRLTADRLAGKLAPWLLFFSGGLGFIWFFGDYWAQGKDLVRFLQELPKDYTIGPPEQGLGLRWGNALTTLFLTQRSLLLGMPLTIIVLQWLWGKFNAETLRRGDDEETKGRKPHAEPKITNYYSVVLVGFIAGLLPLVHLHSLAVLFIVTGFLFALDPAKWKTWLAFGAGVCVIAVPELAWSITGSGSDASEFIGWHFGWDRGEANVIWFWMKNTGLVIPLAAAGLYLLTRSESGAGLTEKGKLWQFYLPFVFCFVVSNVTKLAPWEWDNIKVLVYWFVGSLPFVSVALARVWKMGKYYRAAAATAFFVLIFAGSLDVWRTASGQIRTLVFSPDAVAIAEKIRTRTPADTLFLNAPTYNTAIALTGRQSLMRYPGHLSSHGIDYHDREADVRKIYEGGPEADALLAKYNIDHVIVSQEEEFLSINRAYFNKFALLTESGSARVYKVR